MSAAAPLWLAQPSRFATLTRGQARVGLLLVLLLLLASLTAVETPGPPPVSHDPAQAATDRADPMLYDGIIDGVRHGGDYYSVAADSLREGGYPLKPFVAVRLPTLAVALALAPRALRPWLLYLLGAVVMIAWSVRLRPVFARAPPRWIATALLAGGMIAAAQPELATFHDVWAGLFIALSLARRRPGRWLEPVAWGLCALLIRETALLYALVMAFFAALEGERREIAGWVLAIALFAAVVALHAHAVAAVVRPGDPASQGWAGMLGFGFFVESLALVTALSLLPMIVAAPLVALALAGWAAWRDPLGHRVLSLLAVYAVLIGVAGRTDTFYWAMLVAPIALVGLAFAPDALRDLARAAFDPRRITVTRVAR